MKFSKQLRRKRHGSTSVMSLIFLITILALGTIAGLATVRHHLLEEYGDVAGAIEQLDQSFSGPLGEYEDETENEDGG